MYPIVYPHRQGSYMAINFSDFKKTKYPGLYKSKKKGPHGYKYAARFRCGNGERKKILGYSEKDNLTDRSANLLLLQFRKEVEENIYPTQNITLDALFKQYYDTHSKTDWLEKKRSVYDVYIGNSSLHLRDDKRMTKAAKERMKKYEAYKIGSKKVGKIREMDVKKIISNMESLGLKARTRKLVLETLNPLFSFAISNKILKENPVKNITVKLSNEKRIVVSAIEKFKLLNETIHRVYENDPYYKALFLFGFTGRRKSEVLGLLWKNINFEKNYYVLEQTKNSEEQKFELPYAIKEALLKIPDDREGLVFKSPITGEKLKNIDRQMRKLKRETGIDNLSFHYMRHILVSALAEEDMAPIVLSGILGHSDINTINKYLSINYWNSSKKGNRTIHKILSDNSKEIFES